MRRLQLRFDFDSTAVRLLLSGYKITVTVTRAADPLAAVTLFIYLSIYLFIYIYIYV